MEEFGVGFVHFAELSKVGHENSRLKDVSASKTSAFQKTVDVFQNLFKLSIKAFTHIALEIQTNLA